MKEKLIGLGQRFKERGRAKCEFTRGERGAIDIGGILIMGIGMVFLAVGFIMFPIVTDATDDLLAWYCSENAVSAANYTDAIDAASFTGFEAVVGITPLLVLIGYLAAAVFSMYLGVKLMKGGEGGTKIDLGTILLLGISMIFIAIGLIILPVALDGICTVLHGDGQGISSSYSGLESILEVTPLLLLISFISGAVISGYFGIKKIASGD